MKVISLISIFSADWSTYEIGMETVTGDISVCKHERLVSLTGSPLVREQWSVPIHLIEEMGSVGIALGAVTVGGPNHVVLVVVDLVGWVVARWEVDVGAKR